MPSVPFSSLNFCSCLIYPVVFLCFCLSFIISLSLTCYVPGVQFPLLQCFPWPDLCSCVCFVSRCLSPFSHVFCLVSVPGVSPVCCVKSVSLFPCFLKKQKYKFTLCLLSGALGSNPADHSGT